MNNFIILVVGSVKEEIVNDAPTGRLVLQGIIPQYSKNDAEPAVDICTFFVENPAAVNHIQTYWAQGDTVKVAGEIEFTSEKKITYSDTGFGKPISETSTRTKKELIITSGSPGSLSDEEAYDAEEIQKGLLRRQTRIEEDKARVSSTSTPAPMAKKASLTF